MTAIRVCKVHDIRTFLLSTAGMGLEEWGGSFWDDEAQFDLVTQGGSSRQFMKLSAFNFAIPPSRHLALTAMPAELCPVSRFPPKYSDANRVWNLCSDYLVSDLNRYEVHSMRNVLRCISTPAH